jgi:hypothetical protein
MRVGDGLQSLGQAGDPHQLQLQLRRRRRVPLRPEERRDPTRNIIAEDLAQALPARERERFWNLVEPDLVAWAKALGRPLADVKLLLFAPWIFGTRHQEEDDEGNGRGAAGCGFQVSGKALGELLMVSERCAFQVLARGKKAKLWERFRRCLSLPRLTRDRPVAERLTSCPDPDDPNRELRRLDVHGVIYFLPRGVELIQRRGNTYELRTLAAADAPAQTVRVLVGPQAYLLSRIAKRLRLAAARLMPARLRAPAGGYGRPRATCIPSEETEKRKGSSLSDTAADTTVDKPVDQGAPATLWRRLAALAREGLLGRGPAPPAEINPAVLREADYCWRHTSWAPLLGKNGQVVRLSGGHVRQHLVADPILNVERWRPEAWATASPDQRQQLRRDFAPVLRVLMGRIERREPVPDAPYQPPPPTRWPPGLRLGAVGWCKWHGHEARLVWDGPICLDVCAKYARTRWGFGQGAPKKAPDAGGLRPAGPWRDPGR